MPKAKKKNLYFTQAHEDAIVQYANTDDIKIRTELYIEFIEPAFSEMVDKIVYTYKFTNLPNIDSLREECKIWLTTILDKFDESKKSKAFSYFSVITKNWFIHKIKKNNISLKREVRFDEVVSDLENSDLSVSHQYEKQRESQEFWASFYHHLDKWEDMKLKDGERKVLDAIRVLFENSQEIEIFNKKAIYLYMREITGLNTKQIVNYLNKLRAKYRVFKKEWDEGKI
jgi:hypothetical protein